MAKRKATTKKTVTKKATAKSKSKPKSKPLKKAAAKRAKASKAATPKVSAVKGKSVAWYVESLEGWQQSLVTQLDALIMKASPDVSSSIKWAQPVYELAGPFAFIRAAKKHVTLGFWRGIELDDEQGMLEGDGDKMRHIKLLESQPVPKQVLKKWIKQAMQLNQASGDPTKSTSGPKKQSSKKKSVSKP